MADNELRILDKAALLHVPTVAGSERKKKENITDRNRLLEVLYENTVL